MKKAEESERNMSREREREREREAHGSPMHTSAYAYGARGAPRNRKNSSSFFN
jgi:hypothetical protein